MVSLGTESTNKGGKRELLRLLTEMLYIGYIGLIRQYLSKKKNPFPYMVIRDLKRHLSQDFPFFNKPEDFLPEPTFLEVMKNIVEDHDEKTLNTLITYAYDMMPRPKTMTKAKKESAKGSVKQATRTFDQNLLWSLLTKKDHAGLKDDFNITLTAEGRKSLEEEDTPLRAFLEEYDAALLELKPAAKEKVGEESAEMVVGDADTLEYQPTDEEEADEAPPPSPTRANPPRAARPASPQKQAATASVAKRKRSSAQPAKAPPAAQAKKKQTTQRKKTGGKAKKASTEELEAQPRPSQATTLDVTAKKVRQ
jgi:hypothetical protein